MIRTYYHSQFNMLQIVCKNEVESCSKTKGKLSFRRNQYYEPSMLHIKSLGLLANEMTHPQKQKKHGQFKFYEKRLVINTVDLGSVNLTLVIFIKVFVHHFARKRRFFIHRFIVYIDYWFADSDFHLLKTHRYSINTYILSSFNKANLPSQRKGFRPFRPIAVET